MQRQRKSTNYEGVIGQREQLLGAVACPPAMLSRWKLFGIMSDGSPYQVKWAKRAPLAYQTHIGAGTTDRLADRLTDRQTSRRVAD